MRAPLVLLGPQRPEPNAPAALARHDGDGPVVVITAGWRTDETDDEALRRHLGPDVVVLPLYAWFEVVNRELPELRAAYRARQDELAMLRELYRLRLTPALAVARELFHRADDPLGREHRALSREHRALTREHLALAVEDVRRIDRQLQAASGRIYAAHARATQPWTSDPVVERLRAKAFEALRSARAVAITGGHVAVLLNRLQFFGVDQMLKGLLEGGTPLLAWSAGGMVLTDRIVLFYDDPPDGPADPEVLEQGFGLVPDVVLLPHARQRLRLDDPARIALLAARFAPAACLALENGAWLDQRDGQWVNLGPPGTASSLEVDGSIRELSR